MQNYYLKTTKPVLIQKPMAGIVETVALGKIEGVSISPNFENEVVNYSYGYQEGDSVKIIVNDTFQINGSEMMQTYYDLISKDITIDPKTDFSGYMAQVHYSLFKLNMYKMLKQTNVTLTMDDIIIVVDHVGGRPNDRE